VLNKENDTFRHDLGYWKTVAAEKVGINTSQDNARFKQAHPYSNLKKTN